MPSTAVILEPDATQRAALTQALESLGVPSVALAWPETAAEVFRDQGASLAIVSYEGDGFGLPMAVRLKGLNPNICADCILVADQVGPAMAQAARDLGVLAVLQRPVRIMDLARAAESHLAGMIAKRGTAARPTKIA